jgi:hypothetical protein
MTPSAPAAAPKPRHPSPCALHPRFHPPTPQALQFLALEHKGELSLDDIAQELCPDIDAQQLYRLCTIAWDDGPAAGARRGRAGAGHRASGGRRGW